MSEVLPEVGMVEFFEMIKKESVVVVMFTGKPCHFCEVLKAALERVLSADKSLRQKAKWIMVYVDKDECTKEKLMYGMNLCAIPQLWLYRNGKVVDNLVGTKPDADLQKTLKRWLK